MKTIPLPPPESISPVEKISLMQTVGISTPPKVSKPDSAVASDAVLGYSYHAGDFDTSISSMGIMSNGQFTPGWSLLHLGPTHLMQCCGSSAITGLSTAFETEEQLQGFVCQLFKSITFTQTYYFIAATYQIEEAHDSNFGNAYSVLVSLGAREVDVSPNRNHGPHDMHLHVWSPNANADCWKKYLAFSPVFRQANPLWFSKLSSEEQDKVIEKHKPLQEGYDNYRKKQREAKKKADAENRAWDALYLIKDGRLNELLNKCGLKVVNKNGKEPVVQSDLSF